MLEVNEQITLENNLLSKGATSRERLNAKCEVLFPQLCNLNTKKQKLTSRVTKTLFISSKNSEKLILLEAPPPDPVSDVHLSLAPFTPSFPEQNPGCAPAAQCIGIQVLIKRFSLQQILKILTLQKTCKPNSAFHKKNRVFSFSALSYIGVLQFAACEKIKKVASFSRSEK